MLFLKQSELFNVAKDGVKVPIAGYKFNKDGTIIPNDDNSYIIGKDNVIIPKDGYVIGNNGLIVKEQQPNFMNDNNSSSDLHGMPQVFDFSKSNLVLMVGGQILILVLLLIIVYFGTSPLSFPANAVKKMINGINSK